MSDILDKLLSAEKRAAALVAEAEREAHERSARARAAAQRRHADLLTARAAEAEKAVDAERTRIAAERAEKNAAYRRQLEALKPDPSALARAAEAFIHKGKS
jgi:vacuolar-type H+-ATPase subunit H